MTKRTQIKAARHDKWIDSLPPILLDRIRLCSSEREVPPEIPLMAGLAAIAASLGPGLEIQSGDNRTTRANLFILLGVSSGIGKSEVFKDLLGPLLAFEDALHRWWEDSPVVKARAGEELLRARISGMRTEIRKLHSGLVTSFFEQLQETERARMACETFRYAPSLLADDSTSEALAQMMFRSNESIASVSADARYFLKRLGTPDTKEESFFLKGFSGDLTLTNRVSRNAVRLRRPCLTALLLTQRDAYSSFMQKSVKNRSGLLPRFLHARIDQSIADLIKVDGRKTGRIRNHYSERIRDILEAYRFESVPTIVEVSDPAKQFIDGMERECRNAAMTDESLDGEVLRRRAEQTWRVCLCLHAVRYGNTSALHPLELSDAQTAAEVVARFTVVPEN